MQFNYLNLLKENCCFIKLIIILDLFVKVQLQFIRPVEFSKKEKNKFITKTKDLSISLFEISHSYSNIHVDFGKPQQQVIIVRDAVSVKLKINFQIYTSLPVVYESVKFEFCYQISIKFNPKCNEIPNTDSVMMWFNLTFGVKWLPDKTGLKLQIDPPASFRSDLSGFYYFKSSTPASGMILSNFLEIRDKLFWEINLLKYSLDPIKMRYTDTLSPSNLPILFPCLDQAIELNPNDFPYWIAFSFKSIVKWTWCPVSKKFPSMKEIDKTYVNDCLRNSISNCERQKHLCPKFIGDMPGWSEAILFNGTIALTKGARFIDTKLNGYALMCYHQSASGFHALRYISNEYDSEEKEFNKGLQWNSNDIQKSQFKIISPVNQTIRTGILMKGFILNAFYQSPPNYTYEWIRNGKRIFLSHEWLISRYSLQFKSQVTLEMEGYYYLRIKSLSQSYLFTFDLVVTCPPMLINSTKKPILSSVYLMINSNYSISYFYKGNPTHANIYINGIMYKPFKSDRQTFLSDLAQKSFNLNHLDFEFFQKQLPNRIMKFTYKVNNVLFPETLLRGQDHSVILEVANEYGVSRSLLNIYVLKPPKFENIPTYDNCTSSCSSRQPHLFRCELNTDYYTTREIFVQKFWFANDQRLDVLPHYNLYFMDDTKGLNLNPVISNNTKLDTMVKLMLKDTKLICRVRLLYPGSENKSEDELKQENRIIYATSFSSEIKLDWEPVIVEASYTWIIFLVIALILIVMFIFLLVKFTLKGQGKSYQIEKLEIAKGYNRDEELIENETIKPYLRSYTNNSSFPSNHLEKDSSKDLDYSDVKYLPPNGNGKCIPRDVLDIIDDEETTIDPSKFNEEGSFIGVYATKNNHSNLPPEIKINDI